MERRTLLPAAAALAALLLAAGCGSSPTEPTSGPTSGSTSDGSDGSDGSGSSSSTSGATAALLEKPWLVRVDSYGGPDGEARTATYVSVVPATGRASAATLPEVGRPEVGQTGQPLLVDAGQGWAVTDNRPSAAMRSTGRVVVYDLADQAKARVLDVRRGAGAGSLTTDWVSFDPAEPGVLRVVSGSQVWKVAVPDGTVTRDGSLPERKDWIYGGGFDQRTGQPYIESIDSFATLPAGNETDKVHLLERDGGTQIDTTQGYGDLPDPGAECGPSAAFTVGDGTTVAFCLVGRTVKVKTLDEGAKSWTDLGTSGPVAPAQTDPQFVLPPVS